MSVIGYGAWEADGDAWGSNESDETVIESMHAALEAGIDWIDTAEVYGKGESERLVGLAVAGRRDEVLIATKVAPIDEGTACARIRSLLPARARSGGWASTSSTCISSIGPMTRAYRCRTPGAPCPSS